MNQRQSLILIICLLLTSLAASGWLFYQNLKLQKQISQLQTTASPTPLVLPKPSAAAKTADETVASKLSASEEWLSYTYGQPGLSFKAPLELIVYPNEGVQSLTLFIQNYRLGQACNKPQEECYQLHFIYQKMGLTQQEFINYQNNLSPQSVQETTVGGHPAIQGQIAGERNRFVTYILKNDGLISMYTSELIEANRQLTNQILSTFKFTD